MNLLAFDKNYFLSVCGKFWCFCC